DNLHLSNHFFGGGVSGNPKIDNYTVALDHLAHWMHYTEVYVGATFGMRDANFKDLGWTSKVKSFTWENYFTSDGNAPWRCTVTFEDPLPSNYKDTNQFWNMDKNTGNYIVRNNTFEGGLAHAMYLGLANGTVENNRVENFAYPGLILNCLIRWDRWAIGTPINNVIIRGNTLKDCNKALRDPAAMFVGGGIDEQPSDYNPVSGRIVSNVLVENNTVESTPWAAFGTFSSKNIVIRNNNFINASTTAKKSGKPGGNVFITNADNIYCTGNTVYHGAVSYETGIYVDSSTTTNVTRTSNKVQQYVKTNGLYGEILVDTNTYGFEKVVGTWSNSSYGGYKGTVLGSSSTGAQIRWRPLLRRGHYEVLIYKVKVNTTESADEATDIKVYHKNGTYSTTMNSHTGTSGFVSLGTFEFAEGNTGYVQATRSSSTLRVSAVKFVRKDECTHGAKQSVVAPTCTAKGYTQRACSTCGYTYKQDYTVALGHTYKYTNAGTTHKITCSRCSTSSTADHSYTDGKCVCGVKDSSHNLYFDFKNSNTDKARYALSVYGGYNFDRSSSPYWATGANGGSSNLTIDNSAGTLSVKVIADPDSAGNYGPYIETTNTSGKYPWSGESYRQYYPLAYDPSQAEYIQLRVKFTDCTSAGTSPRVIVCYDTLTDSAYKAYENLNATVDPVSQDYQVITIPTNSNFVSVDQIKSLGFRFRDVKATNSNGGAVVIDYIFVGKRTEMPQPLYKVTFCNEDGTVLQTAMVSKGGTATYTATTPKKAGDATNHYTFKGWNKTLTNITADTTVTATYTAAAHTWSYATVDASNHKNTCSCGYTKTEAHSYSYKATKNPTTSATGTLTGTCSACSGTTTVTLPKLNTTDYTKTTTKAPTCTATGTDKYTWKTTTYGSFYFTVTTAAKGHTEVIDKAVAPTCTATGLTEGKHCSVCNAVLTAQTTVAATGHSYTYKATKNPTTSATGTLTGTCSA
ncbi:MAG: right-handed parallel beta-helix repeat-containing protein, partial [Oscillospiraceae bacterium]|nr:right-handed parallel beta-helix repeat-containing protein [Oscillospiraceae bacterium]